MKKFTTLFFLFLFFGVLVYSQNYLLKIDNQQVTIGEFEKLYLKNSQKSQITEDDFNEYLDLFINYKLKLKEAYNQRYDTIKSINDEHMMYMRQLAEPYFVDKETENRLLQEAYERSKKEVRLSYILIKADIKDTTAAYKKAMDIYKRLMKKENFDKVAVETSEAQNVKQNGADAWYNRVLWMPYEMENFAFNGKVGDISKPIHANNAYFILKITDIRYNIPKETRASHIYIRLTQNSSEQDSINAYKKADSISNELKSGKSFEEVALKYSEDKTNSAKGGDLGWFTTGRMFKDFENAVYSIKNIGEWVGPIRTPAGIHFIKLTDRKFLESFDKEKDDLLKQLQKNPRYSVVKDNVYAKLKSQYNYKQLTNLDTFYKNVDSSILQGKWKNTFFADNNQTLFVFADKSFTIKDFADYLEKNQKNFRDLEIKPIIDRAFNQFVNDNLKDYEISQLPLKDKEFGEMMKEYYDGLIIFEITNNEVWQKANNDTAGLRLYYNQNRKNYTQRLHFSTFQYSDKKTYKKLLELLKQKESKNLSDSAIVKTINAKKELVKFNTCICKQGENDDINFIVDQITADKIALNQNIVENPAAQKIYYLYDSFDYVRGLVIADYQEVLMQRWIDNLRKKYNFEVNQQEWEKLKAKYLK